MQGADNNLADIEDASDEDLEEAHEEVKQKSEQVSVNPAMPTITPEILAEEILRIAGARELTICTAII